MVSIVFLAANEITFSIFGDDYEKLILQVAKNEVSKKEIAQFFRQAHKFASDSSKSLRKQLLDEARKGRN